MTDLQAAVEFILYPRGEHVPGFTIFRSRNGKICKGSVPWQLDKGDMLILSGEWKPDAQRPERPHAFCFTDVRPDIPTNPRALLAYACDLTKGIGPAKEEAIWNAYGAEWPSTSQGLAKVSGLRKAARDEWTITLERLVTERHKADAIAWLMGHGCTHTMAAAAWVRWGREIQGRVAKNPYALTELPGWGFAAVDGDIRKSLGIADDDPRRADAALVYVVGIETKNTGSTIVSVDQVRRAVQDLVGPCNVVAIGNESRGIQVLGCDLALATDFKFEHAIHACMFGGSDES